MRRVLTALAASLVAAACSSEAASKPLELELRVTSYNIRHDEDWWEDRFELMADQMVAQAPDLVSLQEVGNHSMQLEVLQRMVKERDAHLDYAIVSTHDPEPFFALTGEGLGLMNQRPVLDMDVQYLTEGSICSFARIDVDQGQRVDVYNAHLQGGDGADAEIRSEQVADCLSLVEEHDDGWPAFFTGDFNATTDDAAVQAMLEAGFVDTCSEVHGAAATTACPTSPVILSRSPVDQAFTRQIDYVFFRPGDKLDSFEFLASGPSFDVPAADGLYPSDHLGMTSDFRLVFP